MEGITCELQFLGTGHATVPGCYNTCFVLRAGTDRLSVDAGGGNGILRQFRRAGLSLGDLPPSWSHTPTRTIFWAFCGLSG